MLGLKKLDVERVQEPGEPCFPGSPPLHARILFHGHPWRRGKGECLTQAILEKCDERCADADGRDERPGWQGSLPCTASLRPRNRRDLWHQRRAAGHPCFGKSAEPGPEKRPITKNGGDERCWGVIP